MTLINIWSGESSRELALKIYEKFLFDNPDYAESLENQKDLDNNVMHSQESVKTEDKVGITNSHIRNNNDTLNDNEATIEIFNGNIIIKCKDNLLLKEDFKDLMGVSVIEEDDVFTYILEYRSLQAYVIRHILRGYKVIVSPADGALLKELADKQPQPKAWENDGGKHVSLVFPRISTYKNIVKALNGRPKTDGTYQIMKNKVMDLETMNNAIRGFPKFQIEDKVLEINHSVIPGFDGTFESLKTIPINVLNTVQLNDQSFKSTKKSKKTLEEKMHDFGITNLYDLVHWLPRRYIDKSQPQDISSLIIDESATIVGRIIEIGNIPNNMGVYFTISNGDSSRDRVKVNFWKQFWLERKFKIDDEVLVTGKVGFFNKKINLNGASIEHSKEAELLPIVPIYKQSPTKGISTAFLLSSIRELFSRLDVIKLPAYLTLSDSDRINYYDAFKELHLPTGLDKHKEVIDALAYYELISMQLIIQHEKRNTVAKEGLKQVRTSLNLQKKAVATLPFELTDGQSEAVAEMNDKLAGDTPSSTLVLAEVGAGKTIIAQLAALRSVENGKQAVLIGPTDVLSRQLFETFENLVAPLNDAGENIKVVFLGGGLKVREKKAILKDIESGEAHIIVGTTSVMGEAVKYNDLGFIAIDEQQKFGAEQRSKLLNSRGDGRVPDLLMQTATPIPRSSAQVFYGDIDMIQLIDKPKGRKPIVTEWVAEDPNEIITQLMHPIWSDVIEEAELGNQTFIITPLVSESTASIDAASVERTFKSLKNNALNGLNVAMVHGGMKKEEQAVVMGDFKNKKYDVLIASTVVEVGVDVKDATRVIVLSADRFGASSLHQIRGRVGRNDKHSKCYLVSLGKTKNSQVRLQSLVDYSDGFEVSKIDLETRGSGTIFSSDQSGASEMIFASLSKHSQWIDDARVEALEILDSPYALEALNDARNNFNVEDRLL